MVMCAHTHMHSISLSHINPPHTTRYTLYVASIVPPRFLSCSRGENFLHGCEIKSGQRPGDEATLFASFYWRASYGRGPILSCSTSDMLGCAAVTCASFPDRSHAAWEQGYNYARLCLPLYIIVWACKISGVFLDLQVTSIRLTSHTVKK